MVKNSEDVNTWRGKNSSGIWAVERGPTLYGKTCTRSTAITLTPKLHLQCFATRSRLLGTFILRKSPKQGVRKLWTPFAERMLSWEFRKRNKILIFSSNFRRRRNEKLSHGKRNHDASLSQLFRAKPEIGKLDLHQMQRVQNNAGEVAQNVHIPAMNKESLLFLAMKSSTRKRLNNNHEFNMSPLNAIKSL